MNPQGVLRQPRGPPLEAGSTWRNNNGVNGSQTPRNREEHERKPSVSSEYSADSPRQETVSFGFGEDGFDGGEEQVYSTTIESPSIIWAQKADSSAEEEMEQLAAKLQVFCSNRPLLQNAPIRNKIYGGIYNGDGQWYRCKILEIINPENIKVRFIDYGNTEILTQHQIVKLSSDLYNYSAFARQFVLKGVSNVMDQNSNEFLKGTELLSSFILDKLLTVKNKALSNDNTGVCLVDLVYQVNGQDVDVNQEMRKHGFSASVPRSSSPYTTTKPTPDLAPKTISNYSTTEKSKPANSYVKTAEILPRQNGEEFTSKRPLSANEGNNKKVQELEEQAKGNNKKVQELEEQAKNQAKTIETLKQLCLQLEKSKKVELEDAQNKLNEHYNNAVSKKVSQLLGCVSHVRKLRHECSANGNGALKVVLDAKTLLQGQDRIDLEKMEELSKVKLLESMHKNLQDKIKECADKSELPELVTTRDQTRQDLYNSITSFIEHVNNMGLDVFKAKLEVAQSSLKLQSSTTDDVKQESVTREAMLENVKQYEEYMVKKGESLTEMHELVNKKCKSLSDVFSSVIKSLDVEKEVSSEISSVNDLDNTMVLTEALIQEETAKTKASDEEVSLKDKALLSCIQETTKQLDAIVELRDGLLKEYALLQDKLKACKDTKPDIEPALTLKKSIRGLKSKLRHKLVDKDDMKEMEDFNETDANKLEEELNSLYNDLHAAFVEEENVIGCLAKLTTEFPELPLQYPDQGIKQFLETNGLVKNSREIEHFAIEETSEPTIFHARFCGEKCDIKEYFLKSADSKKELETRALNWSIISHNDQLIKLDCLFYSKNGRSAYLQLPFYQSLDDWLQTEPKSNEIIGVLRDALEALHALHCKGLVHGEVTSCNMFVTKQDDGIMRGILGHYDFSENLEQRISRTSNKIGLPADVPKCSKFDVICLGKLFNMKLLNEGSEVQSLIDALTPAQPSSIPSAKRLLDMALFSNIERHVDEQLD